MIGSYGAMAEVRELAPGEADGEVISLDEPLSLWGGLDVATGEIIDPHHPQAGASITAKILVMESGRGSSSSASVLAEAITAGTAPAGIVLAEPDEILVAGAVAAEILYGRRCPVVLLEAGDYAAIRSAARAHIEGGTITWEEQEGRA